MKIIITESKRDRLALNWLNNGFGNLSPVNQGDTMVYVDEVGLPIFYYQGKKDKYVYINYVRIWSLLLTIFGLKHQQAIEILEEWLEESYNITGLIPKIT